MWDASSNNSGFSGSDFDSISSLPNVINSQGIDTSPKISALTPEIQGVINSISNTDGVGGSVFEWLLNNSNIEQWTSIRF